MFRCILLIIMLSVYLPVANVMLAEERAGQGLLPELFLPLAESAVESNKEIAYQTELSLAAVEERVESAFEKGELAQEQWEQFKQLHWETKAFHHLFLMANLCYEEAPVDTYGHLVDIFARDMLQRLVLLDRFCIEMGVEVVPSEII